jgi:mRNA interferase RelE/StbE
MTYRILITDSALQYLKKLEPRIRQTIKNKIEELAVDPEKRGKPLSGDLVPFRSIHAAGRYRVIYEVKNTDVLVIIVAVGIRKDKNREDVYQTLKRFINLGLIEPQDEAQK